MIPDLDPRQERGQSIAALDGQVVRLGQVEYQVKSQSGRGFYRVHLDIDGGSKCSCPDHIYREVKCKHIWACGITIEGKSKWLTLIQNASKR